MKKALIFDPYLDSLGGGERYVLSYANALAGLDFEVTLAWNDRNVLTEASKRFGQDYSQLTTSAEAYQSCVSKLSLYHRYQFQKNYDLIFWVSDGSFPFLFGKNNLLHLQVPFTKFGVGDPLFFFKKYFISKFVCNSQFTKNIYTRLLPASKLTVLYPPVDTKRMSADKKEKWIISVARFDSPLHHKRQDLLIDAFKKLYKENPSYKLFLVGGSRNSSTISDLITKARGLPIDFVLNPSFAILHDLYSKSRFFWHAAGFEVDEVKSPEKVEHFGITTVEAMGASCIPVVIKKGGQKEIIQHGLNGYLCDNLDQLVEYTNQLINDPQKRLKIKKRARKDAATFSLENFKRSVSKIVSKL